LLGVESCLFGFVKDIGRKIFNKDEEAADEIKSYIEGSNPGINNLEVTFDNGIVGFCGDCDSSEANREVIEDPDMIYPGQKIRMPF
jgi:hypothetical protein